MILEQEASFQLHADETGLSLVSKTSREKTYTFVAQPPVKRSFDWHFQRADGKQVAGESYLRVHRTAEGIHIDVPCGRRLLDCPRKVRGVKTYGTRGADPRHEFSWKSKEYMLSGHFRFGGKHRVCQETATGRNVVTFKHSLIKWRQEGIITVSSQLDGEDFDVVLAAFLGFYMFDERRDSKVSSYI